MEPILKVGGLMYYKKINIDDFKTDDILVYRTKEHIVSHRVVKKLNSSFITKGDVNDIVDSEVYNQNVLGRGTNFSIPLLGYFADFIYYHKYILIIIFGLIIIDQIIHKDKERREFRELYS
jgi:signal peptidase